MPIAATDRDPLLGIQSRRTSAYFLEEQRRRPTIFHSFASRTPDDIVDYNANNHLSVLLQMHGSVWGRVLPWCLAVCLETLVIIGLRHFRIVDLTISDPAGHNFMSLLVSFLLVTRATITYNRFMEARGYLSDLYRSCREVVQYACILTAGKNGHPAAVLWRQQVAYKTIICLRMAAAAVEFRSMGRPGWNELGSDDVHETELLISERPMTGSTSNIMSSHHINTINENSNSSFSYMHQDAELFMDLAHGLRTAADENMRAPIVWSYNLRQQLLKPRIDEEILKSRPLHANEELKLLALVSDYLKAFHGHKKLITTPFPFPMVQMARTFLFFWVFSLPFVLVSGSDSNTSTPLYTVRDCIEVLVILFICTYGFLGLEYVSVELDDPYGDDPNDFPVQRWCELVIEDIYLTIYKTDGYESAIQLKQRIEERINSGSALEHFNRNRTGMTESMRTPSHSRM